MARAGRAGSAGVFEPAKAGWLFADLMLVLSIVTLGAATVPDDVPLSGLRVASVHTAPRVTPAPVPRPALGIERTPTKLSFTVDTGRLTARDPRELGRLRRLLVAGTASLRGRRAALVLTFGCDPDSRVGSAMSVVVNSQLRAADAAMFRDTVTRNFMDNGCARTVRLEIYLFGR
jgi:hypothetical protein